MVRQPRCTAALTTKMMSMLPPLANGKFLVRTPREACQRLSCLELRSEVICGRGETHLRPVDEASLLHGPTLLAGCKPSPGDSLTEVQAAFYAEYCNALVATPCCRPAHLPQGAEAALAGAL